MRVTTIFLLWVLVGCGSPETSTESVEPTAAHDGGTWGPARSDADGDPLDETGALALDQARDEDLGDEDLGDEDLGDEDLGDEDLGDEHLGDEDLGDEDLGDTSTVLDAGADAFDAGAVDAGVTEPIDFWGRSCVDLDCPAFDCPVGNRCCLDGVCGCTFNESVCLP